MPVLAAMVDAGRLAAAELVFVDDAPPAQRVNSRPCLSYADFLAQPAEDKRICVAIANSQIRRKIVERCTADGLSFVSVVAANAVCMDDVQLGEGAILSPFVTLTSNIRIGRHFHCNLYSYVEHDCTIGDFVTFAPGVQCNGNVRIEDHAYLGAGCVIRQGKSGDPLVIGAGAVVGMGAVVTKSVPPGAVVVGNPAKLLGREL
jgi:sugar O-acyltransferase (sialic acid O-acetyltransferase NeuD family)